jgi:4-amino-4-deoxy-L-arabinose transferase-like glycosyltransferase
MPSPPERSAPGRAPRAGAPRLLLAAIAALVALRVAFWLLAPPNSDEAYYWLWGLHPDLSYFDHPPLHAWIQGLFRAALGRSTFVLRLPAALTTAGTILVLARMAARLGGPPAPAAVAAAVLGSPLLLMLTSFAWHDHLLVFLVVLSGSLLVEFLAEVAAGARGRTSTLLLGAVALGLAGLAKYSAVFLGVGFALAVVTDRRLRRLLLDGRLWAAAALSLAVLSPVIAWNLRHDLASFRFHLVDRHLAAAGVQLRPLGPVHFLAPTLVLLSPALIWAMGAALRRRPGPEAAGEPYPEVYRRVALGVFAASTAVFLGLSVVSWSLYYWNIVAYLLLVPPAALVLAARPRLMAAHLGFGILAVAVLVAHATVVPLTAPFPGIQDDDSREPFGWSEVARAVREELRRAPGFAATSDYRSGAHLAFALGSADVEVLSGRRSEFDFWLDPARRAGQDAALITDHRDPMSPLISDRFERVTHLATIPVVRLGFHLKDYELWRAEGFRPRPALAQSTAGAAPGRR